MPMVFGRMGNIPTIKSWSYEVVELFAADGSGHIGTFCEGCLPDGVDVESDEVSPIFADTELDYYPGCEVCGTVHTYMNLTDEGREYMKGYGYEEEV